MSWALQYPSIRAFHPTTSKLLIPRALTSISANLAASSTRPFLHNPTSTVFTVTPSKGTPRLLI
uniref:Uncharacterized protein n=1 Tax=Arundo donax TaxID=35708 RepID=A0A0A9EGQ4_ARUDO